MTTVPIECRECHVRYVPQPRRHPCGVCEGLSDPWPDQMDYCSACGGLGSVLRGADGFCDECEAASAAGDVD